MKKLTLTILAIAISIFASNASAFDPEDLQKLKDTNKCVKCDLTEADLQGAELEDASLYGANLSQATLENANLSNADLVEANLRNANLTYTRMYGAILCNTTMPNGSIIYSGC